MISYDKAMSLLSYDPISGLVTWKVDYNGSSRDQIVGSSWSDGRGVIKIDYAQYLRTHIVWLLMTGQWPINMIDHIDRNSANDAWLNLRLSNASLNNVNKVKSVRDLPPKIFRLPSGKLIGSIMVNGKKTYTSAGLDISVIQVELVNRLRSKGLQEYADICVNLWDLWNLKNLVR